MRLISLAVLALPLALAACGPQPPNAGQWEALTTAASASGTAAALGTRCAFDTAEMTAAFDKALARYVLSQAQKSELAEIAKAAAADLGGEPLPKDHKLCTDGTTMRDRVLQVVAKL
jgi:hypothetical protein